MKIHFSSGFIAKLAKAETSLADDVIEKTESFCKLENHKALRMHKLKGAMRGICSFSVNYKIRIIFEWINKDTALFITFGSHDDVY